VICCCEVFPLPFSFRFEFSIAPSSCEFEITIEIHVGRTCVGKMRESSIQKYDEHIKLE
jgi:hypothetical protein